MIDERFVILAVLVDVWGSLAYVIDTAKGITKPNRVTWFLWTLIPVVALVGMFDEKASMTSIILVGVFGLMPLIIFITSFLNKKAYWKITRFDWICGILSAAGILAWLATGNGNLTIIFSMVANFFAWLPTLVKAFRVPDSESWLAYFNGALASFLTLLTVGQWSFASVALLIYFTISCSVTFALVKFRLGLKLLKLPGAQT
ncbi:MAG TPA: hypothetical protein VFX86_01500 [Candidatus Saccharimonadales bacterium]|nr:hypothetical protein [Candidatus Saccharimonadales bacterium]